MRNLERFGVQEIDGSSLKEIQGEVKWWMYLIAPGGAYILERYEDGVEKGCECQIPR